MMCSIVGRPSGYCAFLVSPAGSQRTKVELHRLIPQVELAPPKRCAAQAAANFLRKLGRRLGKGECVLVNPDVHALPEQLGQHRPDVGANGVAQAGCCLTLVPQLPNLNRCQQDIIRVCFK